MPGRTTRSLRSQTKQADEPKQLSSPPTTPAPAKRASRKSGTDGSKAATPVKANSSKKRSRTIKQEEDGKDDMPHNLGKYTPSESPDDEAEETPKKRKRTAKTASSKKSAALPSKDDPEMQKLASKIGLTENNDPFSPNAKSKTKEHSLNPGVTPYPGWEHPTIKECQEVNNILSKLHGKVQQPERPPMPSLNSAGCGEVPSVLDALIRTCLSANTTNTNSGRAFQGLVKRFGVLDSGIGKGSVNWNNVRQASHSEVEKAIHAGGLSVRKATYIKGILDKVYTENQERAAKLKDSGKNVAGVKQESEEEKNVEVERAEQNVLSLDYLHLLSDDEAFKKLSSFNGIGAKTASCVLLFCLRRPSFAVDTHVFRLTRWLGWVPSQDWIDEQNAIAMEQQDGEDGDEGSPSKTPKGGKKKKFKGMPRIDRDTCFAHCETKVPDELKYPLHYLLIKHGKTCPRCRAITGESSQGWNKGCVIEKLVKRDGARKGKGSVKDDESESADTEEWEEDDQDD